MNNKIDKANRGRDKQGKFVKGSDKYMDLTRPYTSKELEMIKEFEAKRNANK